MSYLALTLIIISAFMHATWNFYAKRSNGAFVFVWLYLLVSTVVYAPFVIGLIVVQGFQIGWTELAFISASAIIHVVYALTLQKGYRVGDLSLTYPIARGTAPVLIAIIAMFIYDEQLTVFGWFGILFIVISVFLLTGGGKVKQQHILTPSLYGVLIGSLIATYTLIDKGAVSVVHMAPLLFYYGTIVGQLLLLSPIIWKQRNKIKHEWNKNRKEAIWVGVLNPLSYILVLTAMVYTPVSYVAPVREISILIGTIMGTKLLAEGMGTRRLVAAGIMIIGVIIVVTN